MNLQTLTNDVCAESKQLSSLGHTLKFDLGGIGVIWIDARENPPVVRNDDLDADCTLYFSERAINEVMVDQTMSPVLATTLGEITVEGAKEVGERFLALMPADRFGAHGWVCWHIGRLCFVACRGSTAMPHKFNASRRHKIPKVRYTVRNWPEYEASLRQRGDLRVWIADDVADHWTVPGRRTPKGDPIYTDLAIETVLTLRLVFHQPLRQTEGFVSSILSFMGLDLPVPDHSTLSRRGDGLVRSRCLSSAKDSLDLVVDSTGLKIYGPGEWRQERFGDKKTDKPRRSWRKLHLGIDAANGDIVAADLTDKDVGDVTVLPDLLDQVDGRIDKFLADGAYDGDPTYQLFIQRPQSLPLPEVIVPPRGAGLGLAKAEDLLRQRDRHVRAIQDQGRLAWQKSSGYNRRALVEATMSRYKRIIGPGLRSRDLPAQETEAMMGVDILNHMFSLGRPVTERIG